MDGKANNVTMLYADPYDAGFTSDTFLEACLTDTSIEVASETMYHMKQRGLNLAEDENTAMDLLLLSEAIKAILMRSLGKEHPLYVVLENMYEEEESG